jgi:hypothetical protein
MPEGQVTLPEVYRPGGAAVAAPVLGAMAGAAIPHPPASSSITARGARGFRTGIECPVAAGNP